MKKKYNRRKGPVQSKKIIYDGIKFASGLEKYMYQCLKKEKIKCKYEGETFTLLNGFYFNNEVYERQANSKGEYKNRGQKRKMIENKDEKKENSENKLENKGKRGGEHSTTKSHSCWAT